MKKAALFVTAALLLALVAPVFAQPFADVPTDHWAYDAIAELAAKGLVEGYPDGTFKGDRALTRYEMAMIVARLLARIEAVAAQIPGPPPPPPAPEVRKADIDALRSSIDTINRLVREFQTDLQALGVRIESIEEELRTLRGQLDKTKITGDYVGQYYSNTTSRFVGANQSGPVTWFNRIRLTATGQVAPNVKGTIRLRAYTFDPSSVTGLRILATNGWVQPPFTPIVDVDRIFLDVNNVLGVLNFRLGVQTVDFGPYGLLLNQSGLNSRRAAVKASTSFGGFTLEAAAINDPRPSRFVVDLSTSTITFPTAYNILAGRLSLSLIPGWPVGVSFRSDTNTSTGALDSGFEADIQGALWSGVSLKAEYMSWTPSGGSASPSYQAGLSFNFSELTGTEMAFSPTLDVWYKNFGARVPVAHTMAYDWDTDVGPNLSGDLTAWGAALGLQLTSATKFTASYEAGNVTSTGAPYSIVDATFDHSLAQNTTLSFTYRTTSGTAFTNYGFYRVQLVYSW